MGNIYLSKAKTPIYWSKPKSPTIATKKVNEVNVVQQKPAEQEFKSVFNLVGGSNPKTVQLMYSAYKQQQQQKLLEELRKKQKGKGKPTEAQVEGASVSSLSQQMEKMSISKQGSPGSGHPRGGVRKRMAGRRGKLTPEMPEQGVVGDSSTDEEGVYGDVEEYKIHYEESPLGASAQNYEEESEDLYAVVSEPVVVPRQFSPDERNLYENVSNVQQKSDWPEELANKVVVWEDEEGVEYATICPALPPRDGAPALPPREEKEKK